MILQTSFDADLMLKKHFLLHLSMLKTVVLLHIFVETETRFPPGFFDEQNLQNNSIYLKYNSLSTFVYLMMFLFLSIYCGFAEY